MGAMTRDRTERSDFNERFKTTSHPAVRRAEIAVIGADYGATSYTTTAQADQLARTLALGPGKLLLDIGSGTGWPGIYLAATTGCHATLTDPTDEGIGAAAQRILDDGISGTAVIATGNSLPFRDDTFDATTSGDVFC
jgi:cyclopropane fatty-acyl-phospholipid synthase-like methyltransferase